MEVQELIQALQIVQAGKGGGIGGSPQFKHTYPLGTAAAANPYYTGPQGLFGVAGGVPDRDIFSTRVRARGLMSALPWVGDTRMYPLFAYLTGFRAGTGSNPTNPCDDAPQPGSGKSCYQTAQFGLVQVDTRELEINRVGQRIDSGDLFEEFQLVNDPLGDRLGGLFQGMPPADALVNGREVLARMIEAGIEYQNRLVPMLYAGNPSNNTSGGGYKEFPGLDILIGTNKVDAFTNTDCPSLDSLVRNFQYQQITSTAASADIVNEVTYIARYLKSNAESMGYNPVKWVITMRQSLFWELTALWPCSYLTYKCQFRATDGTIVQNVSATDQIAMRDALRSGSYLLIDGEKWEVVIDDGIVEESSGDTSQIATTCFASDIYFIPMTVLGNRMVTYMQYLDFSKGALQAAADAHYTNEFWSDGGRFLWTRKPQKRWCIQLASKIQPRLIFRAPFLAARLINVEYCPLIHERQPFPTDDYFVNGGVSTPRQAPSLYSDWNT